MKDLLIEGTFRANERGFGFVTIDPEEPDVYIPKEATNFAMDGRHGFYRRDPTCGSKKLNQYTVSIAPERIKPVDGSIVIAEITYYPDQEYPTSMEGLVKQVIGHKMIQEWIFYQSWWLMEFPQHFLMKF